MFNLAICTKEVKEALRNAAHIATESRHAEITALDLLDGLRNVESGASSTLHQADYHPSREFWTRNVNMKAGSEVYNDRSPVKVYDTDCVEISLLVSAELQRLNFTFITDTLLLWAIIKRFQQGYFTIEVEPFYNDSFQNWARTAKIQPDPWTAPQSTFQKTGLSEFTEAFLGTLDDKERAIAILTYGLSGEEPLSFSQAAMVLGITREAVSQIDKKVRSKAGRAFLTSARLSEDLTFTKPFPYVN